MDVKIKRLREGADIPAYKSEGAAACDLTNASGEPITLAPGERKLIPAGFAMDFGTPDAVALICARSGLATKHGLTLSNAVGVIDSDYRGEICVPLINVGAEAYTVAPGERVAQLMFVPVLHASFSETDELSETARGEGGFGSTGK